MKKAYNKKIKEFEIFLFFIVCLFIFNNGCGLDVYTVVGSPNAEHIPNYDTTDYEQCYFSFTTNEDNNTSAEVNNFQGTSVYYKIYNCHSTMSSEVSNINSYIYSEDNKAKAADRLITSYDFKTLKYKDSEENIKSDILIKKVSETNNKFPNQTVKIRLTDYAEIEEYASYIKITTDSNITLRGKPVRYQDGYTFNFGRSGTDTNSKIPDETDNDVKFTETTDEEDENKWYVPMYAVSVDMNNDYSYNYSVPVYLGCVTIDETKENN